jgi:hypothetical protein
VRDQGVVCSVLVVVIVVAGTTAGAVCWVLLCSVVVVRVVGELQAPARAAAASSAVTGSDQRHAVDSSLDVVLSVMGLFHSWV